MPMVRYAFLDLSGPATICHEPCLLICSSTRRVRRSRSRSSVRRAASSPKYRTYKRYSAVNLDVSDRSAGSQVQETRLGM